jgi:predicted HicB family RNase H-like nuclease
MQSKQKVTLYIPPQLHRKLKIKAAVESEPMSSLAEKAIIFYLNNPEVVD